MIAYPLSLPCASRIEGHSAAISAGLVRTPFEAGNSRQRRAQRVLPHQISLAFMVDQPLWATWLSWVNAHAWDDFFTLNLPGLVAAAAGKNTAAVPVRFASDLATELVPAATDGLWYWRVQVTAEYLPQPADILALAGGWVIGGSPAAPSGTWVIGGTPGAPSPAFINPGTIFAPVTVL
jgi:hypothetical protein